MLVYGLTGGIASGKTTVARMFRNMNVPVFEADEVVRRLFGRKVFLKVLKEELPAAFERGRLSKRRLQEEIIADPGILSLMEELTHPIVSKQLMGFLMRASGPMCVIDIPLLFEAGLDPLCYETIVMDCPVHLQRKRALARPGMTAEFLDVLMARQWPNRRKKSLAGAVVSSAVPKPLMFQQLFRKVFPRA